MFFKKAALILALSSIGMFAVSASAAGFDVTDVEGRKVHFDAVPKTFVVANYIANFMMVGGSPSLDKVVALTKDGWEDTRYGEYQVFTKSFPKMKDLPSIGGYHDDILNAEKILSLHPDVLLIGRTQYAENNQRIKTFQGGGSRLSRDDDGESHAEHGNFRQALGQREDRAGPKQDLQRLTGSCLYDHCQTA